MGKSAGHSADSTRPNSWKASEKFLDKRLARTAAQVRRVDFLAALAAVGTLGSAILLIGILLDHQIFSHGMSKTGRSLFFGASFFLLAAYFFYRIFPLIRYRVNPLYAASILEKSRPSLKNGLINWFLLKRRRQRNAPPSEISSSETDDLSLDDRFFQELSRKTAEETAPLAGEMVVDHSPIIRWGIAFIVIFALFSGYSVFSVKSPFISTARILLPTAEIEPPQGVRFLRIEPGDASFYQGKSAFIKAEIAGTQGRPVALAVSTPDGRLIDQRFPMNSLGGNLYELTFPTDESGLSETLDYRLVVGGPGRGESRSKNFRLTVRPAMSLSVRRLVYHYPAYTGMKPRSIENQGDIRAPEGTRVEIFAAGNVPMEKAFFVPDFKMNEGKTMTVSADDPTTATLTFPLKARADSSQDNPNGEIRSEFESYQLLCVDREKNRNIEEPENPENGANRYKIKIQADRPPVIRWTEIPEGEANVPLDGKWTVKLTAEDPDFGLQAVLIDFRRKEGQGEGQTASSVPRPETIPPLDLSKSLTVPATSGEVTLTAEISPRQLGLTVGETIEFQGVATDNRDPKPNQGVTDPLTLTILPPESLKIESDSAEEENGNASSEEGDSDQTGSDGKENPDDSQNQADQESDSASGEKDPSGNEGESGSKEGESDDSNTDPNQAGGGKNGASSDESPSDTSPGEESNQNGTAEESESTESQGEGNESDSGETDENGSSGSGNASDRQNGSGGESTESSEAGNDGGTSENENGSENDPSNQGTGQDESVEGANSSSNSEEDSKPSPTDSDAASSDSSDSSQKNSEPTGTDSPINPETNPGDAFETILDLMSESVEAEPAPISATPQGRGTGITHPDSEKKAFEGDIDPDQLRSTEGSIPNAEPTSPDAGGATSEDLSNAQRETGRVDPESQNFMATAPQGEDPSELPNVSPEANVTLDPLAPTDGTPAQADQSEGRNADRPSPDSPGLPNSDGKTPADGPNPPNSTDGKDPASNTPTGENPANIGDGSGAPSSTPDAPALPPPAGFSPEANNPGSPSSQSKEGPLDPVADGRTENSPPNEDAPTAGYQGGGGGIASGTLLHQETATRADRANLAYSEKATSLALEYLEDQLQNGVDPKLLERLGWTEEELHQFWTRWNEMKENAGNLPTDAPSKKDYLDALRDLGLRPNATEDSLTAENKGDEFRTASPNRGTIRVEPPREYQDRFRLYNEGISRQRQRK